MTEGPVSSTGSLSSSRVCTSRMAPAQRALAAETGLSPDPAVSDIVRGEGSEQWLQGRTIKYFLLNA